MSAIEIDRDNLLVAGERVGDLTPILLKIQENFEWHPAGRVTFHVLLPKREGAILRRALLRIEAELVIAEADKITAASLGDPIEPDSRRAHALLELVSRWSNALR